MTEEPKSPIDRALGLAMKVLGRARQRSERVERRLLALAAVVFVVAAVLAWRQLPELATPDPALALLAALLAALALAVNAVEFAWSAAVLRAPVSARESLRVSALSSAANILPIPGAVAIRTRALLQGGQPLRSAATVTTAIGIAWVAAAALIASVIAAVNSAGMLASTTGAGGAIGVAAAVLLLHRSIPDLSLARLAELAAIEAVSVASSGARLYVVARTFSFDVSFGEAVTVNLGGILSNVAGFLPGGLGLREIASGAFAALVGVPAAIGVLIAAADRLIMYAVLALVALVVVRGGSEELRAAAQDVDQEAGR